MEEKPELCEFNPLCHVATQSICFLAERQELGQIWLELNTVHPLASTTYFPCHAEVYHRFGRF